MRASSFTTYSSEVAVEMACQMLFAVREPAVGSRSSSLGSTRMPEKAIAVVTVVMATSGGSEVPKFDRLF